MAAKKDYKITKKRNGRYAVRDASGSQLNGTDKVKVLLEKGLIKTGLPKEAPAEDAEGGEG
ncbi:hypothetical protein [Pseudobacteriovorax antillogorgiicola]|uniref:Uncharacterized protein n=1 Tax=Pseudobacteriovorax antillogorgiicola TaxID=1513793 RepID=A0A1Y6CCN0_9BACT|nr:hypothetical protein [Pseudobacteriovorax antillogorgiicola]TCS49331.1 hypothetical protein EDD56_11510 [Pseudobacteriovorax antillogorgiicola]SMF47993.1 hypothetical protein SAMN06296036_114174 [Pseudobacteriovorax antillogorgiicola]